MKPTQPQSSPELHSCPDQCAAVVRKTPGLRRFPRHEYAGVVFLLKAKEGHRVRSLPTGEVEFMANDDELKTAFIAINPDFAAILPANVRSKPRARQVRWVQRNAIRRAKRSRA